MTDNTTVSTATTANRTVTNDQRADPLNEFVRAFGDEAGKRVGAALAEELHQDPEARRAAAIGAGIGVGAVAGVALLAVLTN